jgi:hypothetical protein
MFYQTEAKPQSWRAVAVFEDQPELLIYLHRSLTQVKLGLRTAFFEVLSDDERARVKVIQAQKWQGAADAGRWVHHSDLPIPVPEKAVVQVA